jgi:hypothetical protein
MSVRARREVDARDVEPSLLTGGIESAAMGEREWCGSGRDSREKLLRRVPSSGDDDEPIPEVSSRCAGRGNGPEAVAADGDRADDRRARDLLCPTAGRCQLLNKLVTSSGNGD